MSQAEIIEVLKNSEKPLSVSEITKELGEEFPTKIFRAVRQLLMHKEIEFIELNRFKVRELYGYERTRRMRVYYVKGKRKN